MPKLQLVLFLLVLITSCGCRAVTRSPYDLIESELRTKERELEQTRAELQNARLLNDAYGRSTRGAIVPDGNSQLIQPVKEIVLGTGTGGVDNDGRPGDEELQVVIVPRDGDNSAVKVPATATILAYEIATNGSKKAIGRWDVSADTMRKLWRGGLFTTGYYLTLRWDQLPAYERVRIQVRLQTADGRDYETDRDVTIRVVPGGARLDEGFCPVPAEPFSQPVIVPSVPPAIVPNVPPATIPTADIPPEILPLPTEVRSNRPVQISPARTR